MGSRAKHEKRVLVTVSWSFHSPGGGDLVVLSLVARITLARSWYTWCVFVNLQNGLTCTSLMTDESNFAPPEVSPSRASSVPFRCLAMNLVQSLQKYSRFEGAESGEMEGLRKIFIGSTSHFFHSLHFFTIFSESCH